MLTPTLTLTLTHDPNRNPNAIPIPHLQKVGKMRNTTRK